MASRQTMVRIVSSAVAALGTLVGCLPADDRPPPGSVTFTVSPSEAVRHGTTTADGWDIAFSRLMLDIGRTSLTDGCTEYAEARYDRLLDVTKGSGQRLSIIYGLGQCDVRFRIAPPSPDVLLGTGVTTADKLFMGTYGADAYARNTIAVYVAGSASRAGVVETFRWAFRKGFRYGQCRLDGDAGTAPPINLVGNAGIVQDFVIEGEALFRDEPRKNAKLRFDPFADADLKYGNADGKVTLGELALVPLPSAGADATGDGGDAGHASVTRDGGPDAESTDARLADASADGADASSDGSGPYAVTEGGAFRNADGAAETVRTLADYVYVLLLPTLPRLEGTEQCFVQIRQSFR